VGEGGKVAIHTNSSLYNQTSFARAFVNGFREHGICAEIVGRRGSAEIHITQGPHFAYDLWKGHPQVLHLDRCFYGDPATVVSLGWLKPDGSRNFGAPGREAKGVLPEIQKAKEYRGTAVVFGDYGTDPAELILAARKRFERVYYRPHPKDRRRVNAMTMDGDLDAVLRLCDVAIGFRTSALVAATLAGLYIVTTDDHHACKPVAFGFNEAERIGERKSWLRDLSWKQWTLAEINSGEFWSHLKCQSPLPLMLLQNPSSLRI